MSDNINAANQNKVSINQRNKIFILIGLISTSMAPTFYSLARANILPSILADFNQMQFYAIVSITAVLTMAVATPIAGRLGEIYGRKKLFAGSGLLFLLSIIGCYFAPNATIYALCIAISGACQGFISALNNAIIADISTEEERPKYVGYNSTVSMIMQVIAPILAGLITDGAGWRVVFLVGVPTAILGPVLILKFLPDIRNERAVKSKIDVVGAITFLTMIVPVLVLLSLGGTMIPWASTTTYILLAVTVVSAIILVRVDTRHEAPMISFYIFKNKNFLILFLACLLFSIGNSAGIYLPYYLQNVLGVSASVSGTLITPRSIVTLVATAAIGPIMSKTGKFKAPLIVMLLLSVVSYLAMTFLFTPTTSTTMVIIITAINGLGASAMVVSVITIAMRTLPRQDIGVGVSLLVFVTSLASSLGNAIGGLFTNGAWSKTAIPTELQGALTSEQIGQMSSSSILKNSNTVEAIRSTLSADMADLFDKTIVTFRETVNTGVSNLFLVMAIACAIALVLVFTIKMSEEKNPLQAK